MVVDIVFYVSPKFQIDPKSYVSSVVLQSCYDRSLHWEEIKTNFEAEQIQFERTWRREFEDCEMQIHY
jgi:hypothetical protein